MPQATRRLAVAATARSLSSRSSDAGPSLPVPSYYPSATKSSLFASAAHVSAKASAAHASPPRFQPSHLPAGRRKLRQAYPHRASAAAHNAEHAPLAHDLSTRATDYKGKGRAFESEDFDDAFAGAAGRVGEEEELTSSLLRRSPAARHGMTYNTRVSLPAELVERVQNLVSGQSQGEVRMFSL